MTEAAAPKAAKAPKNPLLRMAVELGPLIIFFGTYFTIGIMWATGVFMVATITALTFAYVTEKRIAPMPLVSGVIVMVFGGLTLILQDETFIKLKPTIVNMIFATVLLGGLAFGQLFLKFLMEEAYHLPDHAWRVLTYRWAGFFIFLAVLNEVIWRSTSTDFWVTFKVWGVMPITILFALAQTPFVMKHHLPRKADPEAAQD